jgi:hypothetical protein
MMASLATRLLTAVNGLPRFFEASVWCELSEDSNGAQPADPLHAINGIAAPIPADTAV